MIRKIEITDEALDGIVELINTGKANGLEDVSACISADRSELRVSLAYSVYEAEDDIRTITIKLNN